MSEERQLLEKRNAMVKRANLILYPSSWPFRFNEDGQRVCSGKGHNVDKDEYDEACHDCEYLKKKKNEKTLMNVLHHLKTYTGADTPDLTCSAGKLALQVRKGHRARYTRTHASCAASIVCNAECPRSEETSTSGRDSQARTPLASSARSCCSVRLYYSFARWA